MLNDLKAYMTRHSGENVQTVVADMIIIHKFIKSLCHLAFQAKVAL